jgi:hypothetical protein
MNKMKEKIKIIIIDDESLARQISKIIYQDITMLKLLPNVQTDSMR